MSTEKKPVKNVILVGVGGQGSILASHLLAEAILKNGQEVKLAETYGGSTRGGSSFPRTHWRGLVAEDARRWSRRHCGHGAP